MGLDQILHPASNIKLGGINQIRNSRNMPLMTSLIIALSVDIQIHGFYFLNNLHHNLLQILILITLDMQCYNFVYSY